MWTKRFLCARARALDEEEEEEEKRDGTMTIVLPGRHFDVPIRVDIAHRVVRWQLARKRGTSTAKTKSRGESLRDDEESEAAERRRESTRRESTAPQCEVAVPRMDQFRDFEHKLQKKVRRLGVESGVVGEGSGREIGRRGGFEVDESNWKTKEAKFGLRSC